VLRSPLIIEHHPSHLI
jgi:hypothetical protein